MKLRGVGDRPLAITPETLSVAKLQSHCSGSEPVGRGLWVCGLHDALPGRRSVGDFGFAGADGQYAAIGDRVTGRVFPVVCAAVSEDDLKLGHARSVGR